MKYGAGREVRVSRAELQALMQKDNGGTPRPIPPLRKQRQSSPEELGDEIANAVYATASKPRSTRR